jgi:hypothetical protein
MGCGHLKELNQRGKVAVKPVIRCGKLLIANVFVLCPRNDAALHRHLDDFILCHVFFSFSFISCKRKQAPIQCIANNRIAGIDNHAGQNSHTAPIANGAP